MPGPSLLRYWSGAFAFSPSLLPGMFERLPGSIMPPAGLSMPSMACSRLRAAGAVSFCLSAATRCSVNGAFFMSNNSFASFNFQPMSRSYQWRPSSTKIQSLGHLLSCLQSSGAKPFPSIVSSGGSVAPAIFASVGKKSVKSMRFGETLPPGESALPALTRPPR